MFKSVFGWFLFSKRGWFLLSHDPLQNQVIDWLKFLERRKINKNKTKRSVSNACVKFLQSYTDASTPMGGISRWPVYLVFRFYWNAWLMLGFLNIFILKLITYYSREHWICFSFEIIPKVAIDLLFEVDKRRDKISLKCSRKKAIEKEGICLPLTRFSIQLTVNLIIPFLVSVWAMILK